MTQAYGKARVLYLNLKEKYLKNKMHPNHLELLKAGKKYFKDNTFTIAEDGVEDKKQQKVKS